MSQPYEIRNTFAVDFDYRVIFTDHVLRPVNPTLAEVLAPAGRRDGSPGFFIHRFASSVAASKLNTAQETKPTVARAVVFVDRGFHEAEPAVLTDVRTYFDAYRSRLQLAADPVVITGGEEAKRDLGVYQQCVQVLRDARLDRHSYAILIGGGAMLDAAGFAASTVHRGVRQLRIPTTVLAQNDAGIGVKNGVDFLGQKNFLGSFYPPLAVLNDFTLLRTLPAAARRDGSAEVVKVGLIRDPAFFDWIERHAADLASGQDESTRHAIRRCAELHLAHIAGAGDPFERGSARPLDFGHWAAHKLEQLSGFTIAHGHAVAVGMAIDVLYSHRAGLLSDADRRRIMACLRQLGFTFNIAPAANIRTEADLDTLMAGLAEFQEHLGGELCVTMLRGIGGGVEIANIDHAVMRRCCADILLHP